ncbi:hypothetical protein FHR84_001416 [Actinopolyspora biskrensis]|uniref:VanZ like family protein n=1 Tax=Actinopolyspora biskrensis TaxID=1470178 RepID=A0A852YS81_9ACTN|nr:hypothetical protein [Actinopolyspora biskrensis]
MLFTICCVASAVILFTPSSGVPTAPPGTDKLVHLALFLALTGTGQLAGARSGPLVTTLVCYAPLSELLQAALPIRRHADPLDLAADLAGVLTALALLRLTRRSHLRVSSRRPRATRSRSGMIDGSAD